MGKNGSSQSAEDLCGGEKKMKRIASFAVNHDKLDLKGAKKAAEEMLQVLENWSEEELKYPS